MRGTVWSTWHINKANTINQLKKIKLNTNNAGQYQHADVIKFIEQLKQVAKEQFNPLDKKNGMIKLFDKNQNFINIITTEGAYNFKDVLKKLKDKAFKASATANKTVKPGITIRQEVQDKANCLNQIYQAVLGIKEGFKEKLCESGGINALSLVLQQAGGEHKSINDYTLYKLAASRIVGMHPRKPRTPLNKL